MTSNETNLIMKLDCLIKDDFENNEIIVQNQCWYVGVHVLDVCISLQLKNYFRVKTELYFCVGMQFILDITRVMGFETN